MLKLRLWVRLLRAVRVVEVDLRRRLRAEFGETLPRFDVMAALARQKTGMTMTRGLALPDGVQRQRHRHHRPAGGGGPGGAHRQRARIGGRPSCG